MTAGTQLGSATGRVLPGPVVDVLLANGDVATLRALQPDDHDALLELHRRTDAESLRLRFFSSNPAAAEQYVDRLMSRIDQVIALVVVRRGVLIGVAAAEPVGSDTAEVAFLVDPAAHGLGIGTLLLEHLAAAARSRGIDRFIAEVLAENAPMIKVFTDAGFDLRRRIDRGVIILELDTVATANAVAAADLRESRAEARSLEPLLHPRAVAIAGVRRDGTGVGHAVLQSIMNGGYTGTIRLVHPQAPMISGIRADRDFAAIDDPVDLVIIAVPAERVLPVITEAAEAGVRAAVVLASGFSELGEGGRTLQHQMVRVARRHGMRIVGPNCLGVITGDLRLNATFVDQLPPPGGLAIASQSGGVGIALIDAAARTGLGVQSFISLGNKADVSGNDLLGAWMNDDRVSAAALYLESFGNPQKFARLGRRFAESKPLLAVIGGRSAGGRRAGASHTAAAAPPSVGVQALFAQAGVIDCRDLDELADTARLLQDQPLPAGLRVGIVSNAGGLGVLAADAAASAGLLVPELSQTLRERIAAGLGSGRSVMAASSLGNPVDLGAGVTADGLTAAVGAVSSSGEVDAVLIILAGTAVTDAGAVLAGLDCATEQPGVPRLLVAYGPGTTADPRPVRGGAAGYVRMRSAGAALAALAHAARYRSWREGGDGGLPAEDRARAAEARRIAQRELAASTAAGRGGWLGPDAAARLLEAYGIPLPAGYVVAGAEQAVAAADRCGYPVVIKAADPTVVHKTDRGLVRTGLPTADAVRDAAAAMTAELGDGPPGHDALLVQPQIGVDGSGVELAFGVVRDPSFGPLVMVAAGGVAIDVWADRVFLMPPFSRGEAARALRRLRIWPLLAGHRGSRPADVAGLETLLLGLGRLCLDVPELAELDLNPVIALAADAAGGSIACVDVKVRLAEALQRGIADAPGLSPS
jgi:acyl-CoA synthetase (NDP forming)/GNAT superfamily N-acetyltransferase